MKILFVCSGNSYRSPVAEALLKQLRPDIDVDSAGTDPAIPISEAAKKYLARENAQGHLKTAPEDLSRKDLHSYDLIVAMKPEHKEAVLRIGGQGEENVVVWNVDDPYFLPHGHAEKIFKEIKSKVLELASAL